MGTGYDEVTGLGSLDAATFVFGYATASKLYKPTVTYNSHVWPVNQDIPMAVEVAGAPYAPAPTGNVVLTAGSYTSPPTALTNAYVYVTIPTGKLAMGNYAVSVTYTPDAASSSIYLPATGTGSLSVTAPEYIAPVMVLVPSSTSITNTQPITVSVSVGGGSGNPVPTGTVTATNGSYSSGPVTLTNGYSGSIAVGEAVIGIPAGVLPVGIDRLAVTYTPDAAGSYLYIGNSTATLITNVGASTTPTVTVTPSVSSASTADTINVTVAVSVGSGAPNASGSVTLKSGNYSSAQGFLNGGTVTISILPGSLAPGADTLTATYSGDANYSSATGTATVSITLPTNASFGVAGTSLSIAKGANSGNYSTLTVTPTNGFAGTVAFAAAITSGPAGGQYPPTLSFQPASLSVMGSTAATAKLIISTTAATSGSLVYPPRPWVRWYSMGGAASACVLLFCFPARRGSWRSILGMLMLLFVLVCGVLACGGGGGNGNSGGSGGTGISGTTSGTYTITVTGTSGSTTATGTVTLTVQ